MSAAAITDSGALGAAVEGLDAVAYSVPTDAPEADGTLGWDSTTIIVVMASGAGATGLGWTYGAAAVADLIRAELADLVTGRDVLDVVGAFEAMVKAIRNIGRSGVGGQAISAVDTALWDLKARLLGLPLHRLLGAVRDHVDVYGSGAPAISRRQTATGAGSCCGRIRSPTTSTPRSPVTPRWCCRPPDSR